MSRNTRRRGSFLKSLNPFGQSVDRALEWKRSRRLGVEVLEDRRLLAVVDSPFDDRVMDHFASSTGRNGLAVINVTTGETDTVNGTQVFGTSSTIKLGVLYTLLRKIDADPTISLDTVVNIGADYGTTAGRGDLTPNSMESLRTLAQHMIDTSDNWAANRLMDFVENRYDFNTDTWGAPGTFPIANAEFAALGLSDTRLDRYNTGTSAPSAHGLSGPGADYRDGHDNETTPNQIVSLLQQIHENNGLLSSQSHEDFWSILGLNSVGRIGSLYNESVFANEDSGGWQTIIDISSKNGSNTWTGDPGDFDGDPTIGDHFQRSEAGLVELANGELIFYGMFVDEALDGAAADMALACIGYEVAFEYADAPVTVTPETCQLDDGRVMTVRGTDASDTISVITSDALPVMYEATVNGVQEFQGLSSNIDLINIFGFDGADTFQVSPSSNAVVNVDGGDPELGDLGVPPGDTLVLNNAPGATILPANSPNGVVVTPGRMPLNFANIENFVVPDALEFNDTRATATVLGSEPEITLRNLSIDSEDDADFFKITAHQTGKLIVNAYFDGEVGDIDLEIYDGSGNLVTEFGNLLGESAGTDDDEQVIIPVVSQQMYFIRVFGFNGDVNNYSLEIENFPAPVPTGVHLDPASDTGMMNNDNVTSDTTPTIFIQTDILEFVDDNGSGMFEDPDGLAPDPDSIDALGAIEAANMDEGIAVEVTFVNTTTGAVTTGFANPVAGVFPEVYSFTPATALTPGVYFVTARTKVFDGQTPPAMGRSAASPPLWMTINTDSPLTEGTLDLAASSDTGMFDDDNVTAKWEPTFTGVGPQNAKVHVFAQASNAAGMPVGTPFLVGSGLVGTDLTDGVADGMGIWNVTVQPMDEGKWNFTARFEDASGLLSDAVGVSAVLTANPGSAIPDNGVVTSTIPVTQADFPGISGDVVNMPIPVVDIDVTVNVSHPAVGNLILTLVSPTGTEVTLSSNNGGDGDNFTNTVFDDSASTLITSIVAGDAPFTGRFRPQQPLSNLNGLNAIGEWTLRVTDNVGGDVGTLNNWTLNLTTPLMVVIDKTEPNTPFLDLLTDSGRSNVDNITNDNTPNVTLTTTDPNMALAQLLFQDNLKFRLFDRFQNSAEFLLYDSSLDAAVEAASVAGDGFTSLTFILETLAEQFIALNPAGNAAVLAGGVLADGVHSLKLEVEDRAGNISHDFLFDLTVDTTPPPVSFGLPGGTDGLVQGSDSGNPPIQPGFLDRVTNNTNPRIWGLAEANSVVRVFADIDLNGVINAGDLLIGETVAVPYDGNHAFADGYWEITSTLNLNGTAFPLDGRRQLLVAAEDVAGNLNTPDDMVGDADQILNIFLDTQGPQVFDPDGPGPQQPIFIPDFPEFDLFDPKPSLNGYTPMIDELTINIRDLPFRSDFELGFLYDALERDISEALGNYRLVGDHVGTIGIDDVNVVNVTPVNGEQATATVTLSFAAPLPDDRYTLTIKGLVDPAGNLLDGESNANGPLEEPFFPSGNGVPGGDFVARFTVDSRPEIGTYIPTTISIDINGNFVWDPANAQIGNDFTNVDLTFNMQREDPVTGQAIGGGYGVHDLVFAGKFRPMSMPNGYGGGGNMVAGGAIGAPPRFFDQLAVFGALNQNTYRWLIDTNSDGVINTAEGDIFMPQPRFVLGFDTASAIPIAGNFDGDASNGDEIGLYNAGRWALDSNRNFVIDPADTFINSNLFGNPIVGDFNGDGNDDLAVHNSVTHLFSFDLDRNGTIDDTIYWGFPGVLELPVAADMNQDGIDDIGLWVPRNSTQVPRAEAEWFFLVSNDSAPIGLNVDNLDHAFAIVPFGTDLTAHFGDELARPIVGNFDPPVTATSTTPVPEVVEVLPGDFDGSGVVDLDDRALWRSQYGQTGINLAADGNGDGRVDTRDFLLWRNNLGATAQPAAATAPVPGDYDGDGDVTLADREVWKSQFGQRGTGLSADGNGDGVVDARDFVIWRNNLVIDASSSTASGLAMATEAGAGSLIASAASEEDPPEARAIQSVAPLGFRPAMRPHLESSTGHPVLSAGAVDALFDDTSDELLLLIGGSYLADGDQTDLDDLFDLTVDETEEEAELPLTL